MGTIIKPYKEMEYLGAIKEYVLLHKPDMYVELGTKKGHTFNVIAPLVRQAVGVDIGGDRCINKGDNVTFYTLSTDEFVKIWNDPIDVLFIDACHDYEQVKKDFDNFSPFVVEGTGFIFLHDTGPVTELLTRKGYCSDAWKLAEEIRFSDKYRHTFEICTEPGPWAGLSRIRKAKMGVPWLTGFRYVT